MLPDSHWGNSRGRVRQTWLPKFRFREQIVGCVSEWNPTRLPQWAQQFESYRKWPFSRFGPACIWVMVHSCRGMLTLGHQGPPKAWRVRAPTAPVSPCSASPAHCTWKMSVSLHNDQAVLSFPPVFILGDCCSMKRSNQVPQSKSHAEVFKTFLCKVEICNKQYTNV